MINCSNPNCNADNPEEAAVCQRCSTALPHYYLWGVGEKVATLKPGTLLNDRYLLKRDRIFLDTKPGFVPEAPTQIPDAILPYLHLSVYPLHVPRLYSALSAEGDTVLMLESSAFSTVDTASTEPKVPDLLPKLTECWVDAPPLRQLSWLWQIAQMWESFSDEQVAATLVNDDWVRVDGSVVRLLALVPKANGGELTLASLARSWRPLAVKAHTSIRPFLTELCDRIEQSQINAEQLSEQLGLAMSVCAQEQEVAYNLAVYTDQGPTRKRNEDACFPASGTSLQLASEKVNESPQLLIVCDGIGGHQGGDVASKLAIATIKTQLEPLISPESATLSAAEIMTIIERAICAANDEISAQNDQAQRQARDRMGTTLVLALIKGADVYIAHLGDSRAYRISAHNCQQVTLDDDVASRQVRLGGSLYREMLTQAGAGSLVQALGMGPSQMLRPTVQRFVIDQDCAFLLCSDGLSDSDRVEQFWASTLEPLVTGDSKVDVTGQTLVSIANKYNGHDNVTIGLLAAQVTQVSQRIVPKTLASPLSQTVTAPGRAVLPQSGRPQTQIQPQPTGQLETSQLEKSQLEKSQPETQRLPNPNEAHSPQASNSHSLQKAGLIGLLLALLGVVVYMLFPGLRENFSPSADEEPTATSESISEAGAGTEPSNTAASGAAATTFAVGDYMRILQSDGVGIRSSTAGDSEDAASVAGSSQLLLYPKPISSAEAADENVIPGTIPTGGIAQVVNRQTGEDQTTWMQLKLCSIPSGASLADVPTETGDVSSARNNPSDSLINQPESTDINQPLFLPPDSVGWTLESSLAGFAEPITGLQTLQKGSCEG